MTNENIRKYKKSDEYYHDDSSTVKVSLYEPIKREANQISDPLQDVCDNLVVLSKQTLDLFLKQDKPSDLIALYTFYYYTAKWQKTNQPYCTNSYCQKGLKWGHEKVKKTRKKLIELGLIQTIKNKNDKGQIVGWYTRIVYLWKKNTLNKYGIIPKKTSGLVSYPVENKTTNALSPNSINALNNNNIIDEKENLKEIKDQIKKEVINNSFPISSYSYPKKEEFDSLSATAQLIVDELGISNKAKEKLAEFNDDYLLDLKEKVKDKENPAGYFLAALNTRNNEDYIKKIKEQQLKEKESKRISLEIQEWQRFKEDIQRRYSDYMRNEIFKAMKTLDKDQLIKLESDAKESHELSYLTDKKRAMYITLGEQLNLMNVKSFAESLNVDSNKIKKLENSIDQFYF